MCNDDFVSNKLSSRVFREESPATRVEWGGGTKPLKRIKLPSSGTIGAKITESRGQGEERTKLMYFEGYQRRENFFSNS